MAFRKGKSGNPNGRPKGALSKRSQLAKLLEPKAEELIEKMLELALSGDVNALRLCIERLIPKAQRETLTIEFPNELDQENLPKLRETILRATLEGQISVEDAERLNRLINDQAANTPKAPSPVTTEITDPVALSQFYQDLMGR